MEKTALQLLWEWVDEKYPNFNKADIEEKIKELLPVERDAFVKTWEAGKVDGKNISYNGHSLHESGEQYYETRYGSSFK